MLTDQEIRRSLGAGEMKLEPFSETSLQPASYDVRVGPHAFTSSSREKENVVERGLLVVDPGEFAVVESLETMEFGPQIAAQLGLRSEYARRGLLMLSGPQIDPGFRGGLVVRLVNLAPSPVVLKYQDPFLTVQFFRLNEPVANPYSGPRQDQSGISAQDMQDLTQTEGLTLGGVVKTLSSLAADVKDLRTSVRWLAWAIPIIVAIGMTVIGIVVSAK